MVPHEQVVYVSYASERQHKLLNVLEHYATELSSQLLNTVARAADNIKYVCCRVTFFFFAGKSEEFYFTF